MSALGRLGPPALRRLTVHRYAALFRPLEEDERDRLRASLEDDGYDPLHPIVTTPGGEIVDGRNRRDLCAELGIEAVVVEREFADDAAIAAFVRKANLARRHLSAQERRELAGQLVANGASTRTAAKAAGVSQATARRAAADARAGESPDSPGEARTTGADGKSYPATKLRKPSRPKPPPPKLDLDEPAYRRSDTLDYVEMAEATLMRDRAENRLAWDAAEAAEAGDVEWLSRARVALGTLIARLEGLQRVLDDKDAREAARSAMAPLEVRPSVRAVGHVEESPEA